MGNQHHFYISTKGKRLTFKLRGGEMLKGTIESWDRFTIRANIDGDTVLISKHAIDTIWAPSGR